MRLDCSLSRLGTAVANCRAVLILVCTVWLEIVMVMLSKVENNWLFVAVEAFSSHSVHDGVSGE